MSGGFTGITSVRAYKIVMQICSKSKSVSGRLSEMPWKTQTGELTHQVLIGDEKLVVEFRASAVKLRGLPSVRRRRRYSAFARLFTLPVRVARMSRFFGVSSGEIYSTTETLVAFGFRAHACCRSAHR